MMNLKNYPNYLMNNFLQEHIQILKKKFSNAELELRILLNRSSINKEDIILSNFDINYIDKVKFKKVFTRRINGEPISKIFNQKSFWKHNFFVNQDVLDPRPETELIIEQILKYYPNKNNPLKILDICTGSGCLAISLAKEYRKAKITATDISLKALKIAKLNASNQQCNNQINFFHCDLINKNNIYDIVVSNPPYLSNERYSKTSSEIQLFEPKIALIASKGGLEFYEKILGILNNLINNHSMAFFEIDFDQADKIRDILKFNHLKCAKVVKDIQNLDRVLIVKKS